MMTAPNIVGVTIAANANFWDLRFHYPHGLWTAG